MPRAYKQFLYALGLLVCLLTPVSWAAGTDKENCNVTTGQLSEEMAQWESDIVTRSIFVIEHYREDAIEPTFIGLAQKLLRDKVAREHIIRAIGKALDVTRGTPGLAEIWVEVAESKIAGTWKEPPKVEEVTGIGLAMDIDISKLPKGAKGYRSWESYRNTGDWRDLSLAIFHEFDAQGGAHFALDSFDIIQGLKVLERGEISGPNKNVTAAELRLILSFDSLRDGTKFYIGGKSMNWKEAVDKLFERARASDLYSEQTLQDAEKYVRMNWTKEIEEP